MAGAEEKNRKTSGDIKRQVEYRSIATLIPYASNSRTHSEQQVAQIAASIREFGWTNPILVDEAGTIIAGHGRLLAAQRLGEPTAPCITIDGLSDAQRRALIIADNKLAMNAGWDEDLLSSELQGLTDDGFDMALLGFSEDELAGLLADKTQGLTDPDDIPEAPAIPVSKLGDVWLLGKHRIVCGDSTDALVVEKIGGTDCAMLLSDPPYGIGYEYDKHEDGDNEVNAQLVADVFALAPTARVWTPGLNNLARDITRFGKARVLVWFKKFAAAGNGIGGASTWEPILIVGSTPARKLNNDVLEVQTDRATVGGKSLRELHSCPKPVALYAKLLESLTKDGQAVYEPFSGSGTTIIAGEMTGRSIHAIELSPAYVDVAVIRWQEFTGQQAALEATGETFDALRAARNAELAEAA